jgi:hypothetical protein
MNQRNNVIDQLRSISIILMILVHSARLVPNLTSVLNQNGILENFIRLLLHIEPIISGLFLFVSGMSLYLTFIKPNRKENWVKSKIITALKLIGLGSLLFFLEFGIQIPDILMSSNILSSIGFSMLFSLYFVNKPKSLLLLNSCLLLCSYYLWKEGITILGINEGPGSILPIVSFYLSGIIFSMVYQYLKVINIIIIIILLSILEYFFNSFEWIEHVRSEYQPSLSFIMPINRYIGFWNHTVLGYFGCLFFIMFMYVFLDKLNMKIRIGKIAYVSLFSYLFHLMIIAVFFAMNIKLSVYSYYGFVFVLISLTCFLSTTSLAQRIEKKLK